MPRLRVIGLAGQTHYVGAAVAGEMDRHCSDRAGGPRHHDRLAGRWGNRPDAGERGHWRDTHRSGDLPGHPRGLGNEVIGRYRGELRVADPLPGVVAGSQALEFQSTISWLLAGAGRLVLQRWAGMLAELKLTSSQYKLVLALDEVGPLGQQRLAELVGIDPRNAVPIIETSVEQDLLIRTVDPTDRRRRVLELAPIARAAF